MNTTQRHDGTVVVPLPIDQRPGITLPTPENLDRVAQDAADKRFLEQKAANVSPDALGRAWGVSRDLVLFLQRLEARALELERDNKDLRERVAKLERPAHMRDVERRG
jgi:hypothetical protein